MDELGVLRLCWEGRYLVTYAGGQWWAVPVAGAVYVLSAKELTGVDDELWADWWGKVGRPPPPPPEEIRQLMVGGEPAALPAPAEDVPDVIKGKVRRRGAAGGRAAARPLSRGCDVVQQGSTCRPADRFWARPPGGGGRAPH